MKTGKIDLTKIDKSRLFKSEKTGSIYLDIVMIETPKSEFNDYVILQSISKEEREKGEKGNILGNADNVTKKEDAPETDTKKSEKVEDDDLPF